MNSRENTPPKWATSFFRWFCKREFHEEIEGDLFERYQKRSPRYSTSRNNLLFLKDVITLFRPGLINFNKLTVISLSNSGGALGRVPEFYIIFLVFLAGYNPPFSVSPFALALIAALLLLIILKNRAIWAAIASVFILVNLFMILAMVSEFSEFPTFATHAQQLLLGGSAIFFLNISACGALLARYTEQSKKLIFGLLYIATCGWYGLGSLGLSSRFPEHATSDILFYMGWSLLILALCAALALKLHINKKNIEGNALQPSTLS